ncbi:MAG: TolC family protein [Defluviicoccus sp.]|nr:TolC family protein [Defluviicoccus sp.]
MEAQRYFLTATVFVAACSSLAPSVLRADILSPQAEMLQASESPSAPGRSVDELLAMARAMNPGLAAAALDAQAAQVRIGTTGRYPDPMFRTEFEDITGNGTRYAPDTLGRVKYTVEQTIPLWGKLDLQRKVAVAEAGAASEQRRAVENELAARIKIVFANAYATREAIRINEELLGTVAAIARVAQSRYAQGQGGQQDAVTAEVERGRLQADLARLDGERRNWNAQMNALLNRPVAAPLAPPQALRPVPAPESIEIGRLVERAQRANPQFRIDEARITADERSAELVRRNWYPDLTLGVSVFDADSNNDRDFGGYEAMVSFAIPLQWGLRRAQEGEAVAKLAASRARRQATGLDLQGQIEAAYWALVSAQRGERILREVNIPQTKVVLQSALAGYQLGRVDLPSVLLADQAVLRVSLDRINLLIEQQVRLAEIERVIGEDL